MAFLAINRACIDILPEEHHGKVISFIQAFVCFGKIFFGVLFEKCFNSNLSGFFFTLAILFFLTFGSSFFVLHPFVITNDQSKDKNVSDASEPLLGNQDCLVKDMFLSPFFHGLFWTTVLLFSCGYTCLNNVTIIAESIGVKTPLYYVYVFSVTIIIFRLVCGVLFDKFRSEICGFAILQVNVLCFIASMLIGIFALDTSTMFLSTILYGVGFASSMAIGLSICLQRFGRKCFDAIMGTFYLTSSAAQVVLQLFFGYFFDLQGEEDGNCYGNECFFWSFVMMLVISVVTCAIQLTTCVLSYIEKHRTEHTMENS